MRLNIPIDDGLMQQALQLTGLTTEEVIEEALRFLVFSKKTRVLGLHAGKVQMSEDFDAPLPDEFWLGKS